MRIGAAAVVLILGVSCGQQSSSVAAPSASESPTASPSAACLDQHQVVVLANSVEVHLTKAQKHMRGYDLSTSVTDLRLAASDTRSMADLVTPLDPETSAKLMRAADGLDHAASSVAKLDVANATSYLRQGANDLGAAVASMHALYC